jgi:hypothetical protein
MFGKVLLALVALSTTSAQSATLGFYDVARLVYPDSKSVFAGMQIDAYIPNASLVRTIDEFIGIPGDEEPVQFGPYAMIDGCRRQSCMEKAAVIVDMRSRSVAAVALRNYECRHVVPDDGDIAAMARDSRKRPPRALQRRAHTGHLCSATLSSITWSPGRARTACPVT